MAFQITGKLEVAGETVAITPKNGGQPFYKREFVLDCTRYNPDTGEPWENHPRFELSGSSCSLLDQFKVGQRLTVDFSLRGAKYADQQSGEIKYFTTINAFRITPVEQQQQVPQAPSYVQQAVQVQNYAQPVTQTQVHSQPQFPPQVNEDGLPIQRNDDLPF